jgi:CelD/BcsL family acetyltransferase involved in cellulose biosynthesis
MATGYSHDLHALSPGKVMMNRVLDALSAEGIAIADFGWGDAAYKTMFASDRLNEVTIRVYGRGLRARAACAMQSVAERTTQKVKAIAGAESVAALRRRWRERLRRQVTSKTGENEGALL